jgi:hypothetical protein
VKPFARASPVNSAALGFLYCTSRATWFAARLTEPVSVPSITRI